MIPLPRGRALSVVLLVIVMLIWGSTYVVTKAGLEELPPMLFALLRFGVASACLLPLALLRGGVARLPRPRPWGTLFLMSLAGIGLYYVGFNLALTYTTATQGALVQSSIPAVTAAMAALWLGERVSRRRQLGIVLAIAGVLLILLRSAPEPSARSPLVGNALMLATVICWGAYTMLAKRTAGVDASVVVAGVTLMGTLLLVPPAVAEAAARGALPSISPGGWARIAYLGALPSAGAYILYSRALRDLEASQVGTFINLAPLVGVLSGVVVLGEAITPLAVLGGALVLTGVWLSTRQDA
jgi:drug/metabolite transporter (DMT)-like permease